MNNRHVVTGQKREQNVKSWITSEVPETAPTRACRENTPRSFKLERRPQEDSPALILIVAPYTTHDRSTRLTCCRDCEVSSKGTPSDVEKAKAEPLSNKLTCGGILKGFCTFMLSQMLTTDLARSVCCDGAPSAMQIKCERRERQKEKCRILIIHERIKNELTF